MNKQGKAVSVGLVYFGVFLLVAFVAIASYAVFFKPSTQTGIGGNAALTSTEAQSAALSCGSTKQTTLAITLKNGLNTTAAETDDASYIIYQIQADKTETQVASGSDMTAGAQTLDCGQKYRLKVLGGGTMNSRLSGVYTQNAQIDTDGSVIFTTTSPSMTLGLTGSKHADIVVRAYDANGLARMYDEASSDPLAYKGSGVVFTSTVSNATNTSVTAGSTLSVDLELKNSEIAADFNDYGTLVGFDAANTYWDSITSVTYDGTPLSEMKAQLNPDETKKFANYEFVYLIPQGKLMDKASHKLHFEILKASGASGSDVLSVDLSTRANYLSVDGYTVKTAAAKDSSTNPYTVSLFHTAFDTN